MDVESKLNSASKFIRKHKCGNCTEFSTVAFTFLSKNKVKALDIVGYRKEDHAFLIIGRKSKSEIDDHRTWGNEAVICDAWAYGLRNNDPKFGYYPASQFDEIMTMVLGKDRGAPSLIYRKK